MRTRLALALFLLATIARADYREFQSVPVDPSITSKLAHAAEAALKQFPKLTADNLAISVVDLTKPDVMARGDYHGSVSFYPASVIKLWFMTETFHQGKENVPDVPRALKEMIGVSDNDATAFIVDVITDTCSGPELQGKAFDQFVYKRGVVNRWFDSMGYDVSAMMKPMSFGPYGRDEQLLGPKLERRNRMTANDAAALMLWIARRRAVSAVASDAMLSLLARPLNPMPPTTADQVSEFIGAAVPTGSKLWSKAGWTNTVRHDAAYVEMPDRKKMVVVICTRGGGNDATLVAGIARLLFEQLGETPAPPPPPAAVGSSGE